MNYIDVVNPVVTAQTEQADPRQVQNNAGGYVFVLDDWARLTRFLVLGSEGGTYYTSERDLTKENVTSIRACITADGPRVVGEVVRVSSRGLAPKNDPAVYVLALCASLGDAATRRVAFKALPEVCRIGTHLMQFVSAVDAMRGWGRGMRRAVSEWYLDRPVDSLVYQLVKYQNRNGWTNRDVLRKSHPTTDDPAKNAALRWATHGAEPEKFDRQPPPKLISAYERMKAAKSKVEVCGLVREFGMTHEMVPNQWKDDLDVWAALVEKMPITATIRNLGKMTAVGLVSDGSRAESIVVDRIRDHDAIVGGRVHPMAYLLASSTYSAGKGVRGSLTWSPTRRVIDALDDGFYMAFASVVPSGKRVLIGLDVSGSMEWSKIAGTHLTARQASAAMALVTMRSEKDWLCKAFCDKFVDAPISPRQRLDDVLKAVADLDFGVTDCALPITWAHGAGADIDAVVVYTDNETWAGSVHPHQALQSYRQKVGHDVKLVVVGMTSNGFTVADPTDSGMLDVVGFDASAPAVVSDFVGGRI